MNLSDELAPALTTSSLEYY
jgi:hypothetical protein